MAAFASQMSSMSLSSKSMFGSSAAFQTSRSGGVARSPLQIVAVKRWIKQELNDNGKPVLVKMHVLKGDTVQVIAGADKGKVSEVTMVNKKTGKVLVKDVNMQTKHVKPRTSDEAGQIVQREAPIHHSNVMLYSKEKEVRSRVSYKVNGDGKKVRVLAATGEEL